MIYLDQNEVAPHCPWHGSRQAWRLLNAIAPSLLLQPVIGVPGGLELRDTGAVVIADPEAAGLHDFTPTMNTVLFSEGPYGLCADVWISWGGQRFHLGATLPWLDPETGQFWLFYQKAAPPFIRICNQGIEVTGTMPALDELDLDIGFDSIRLRHAAHQGPF